MLVKLYNENPNAKQIQHIIACLRNGGVIILPTDTVYAFACDLMSHTALNRMVQVKGVKKDHLNYSLICSDLSQASHYTKPISNHIFKEMKRLLPGPYTFILEANNEIPKIFKAKKKTVGIRIPDNNIARNIVHELGNPLLVTTIPMNYENIEEMTDPEVIHHHYKSLIDIVVDAGLGDIQTSTVIDACQQEMILVRAGKGALTPE